MSITKAPFGAMPDGTPVEQFLLQGEGGLRASIIPFGCRIVSLEAPDRNGKTANVVLGHDTLDPYLDPENFQGTAVGRYANRIAGGKFSIGDKTYTLACGP